MASSKYATTSETTNAGRAIRVLLGPCSDMLRDLLQHHVRPEKFPSIIRKKKANHSWSKPQKKLIFPSTGPYSGDYSDFDISLLYSLLRHICDIKKHKNDWGNAPDRNDMSLSANIERIRICRNRLGHALEFSLSDLDFNDIWSSISTAVMNIDEFLHTNQKYKNDVDFLRYEPMDFEKAKELEKTLLEQYMEDKEIKSQLSELTKCTDQHVKRSDQHIKRSDQHMKRSEQKLDAITSKQEMIVKQLETCTKAVIHDQPRKNTSIGDTYTAQYNTNSVQPTIQFLGFIHWILTVFGIMRILNFFWKKEELMELAAKEISYSSVLLQWENTINQRDNSEVLYLIEYGITRKNHAEEKIRVDSCAYRLENLKHSTEYEVQVKAVSPSGEKQHSKKIKFKTKALGKLEYTEITEASILLKWEPKKHTRGEDSAYFVEYETTHPDIKIERVEIKSCEYRLEKLRHSTEYRVQIKVKTDSGETEHTDKIIFETRRHTARGLSETEIQTFERDLKKSKVRLKNVRLMAIGHQGVGKTTLLHRLRNLDSNPSEAELSTISPTKSIKTDLNYAVCNKRGDIICLGEDDICRRKLGMSLEEKEKQTAQKKEVKKSNAHEDGPMQGDTSSYPAKDTKSEKTIEKQTSTRLTNEDTATEINTDSSLVEDVGPSTDTVKSHSSVITDEYTDQTPSEIASQSTHANESEESEKKESVIGDELAQDLGKILKEAQVGTDDEFFISYWDFAGEDAYHDTHVAFMSSDAVYLLLFNAAELVQETNGESKKSQEEHLRFWLQNIASLRSENISTPPVIVIGTHMDELDEKSVPDIRSKVEDIVRQLAKDQGALENLYKIYLKNLKRDGITDIWEGIKRAKEKQEHWNKEVPSKMQILEYILTLEKKKTNSSYSSSTQDIRASWNKIGDTSEVDDDLNLYLKMLSDSGSILFLEHDNNVVLDISWIIKCFANIFAPSKEISEATKCHLKEPRIREDVFTEFILHDEKGENITLKSFLSLGLIVKSNEYITVPAYLPENRDDLASMREMITKDKKTQEIEISSKLSIFFERKNAAKVNIPLSTLFFNSILIVLIDSLQRKGGGKTLSPAQKSTCLTSIGKTSGILDDNQVHGLIYEMKEGTLHLLAYSLERDTFPTNLLQDIISKINKLNNAYHKKPLEMKFEISEGYTVPFKSEKAKKWMEYWTSKCSDCGEWKDIAYQTGQDISFIDDEGWLKGREDLAYVVFKCMKCFKRDDNENREITSHGSNDRRGTGSRSQHLVLSERFLRDLASQIGAEWQLLFIGLGLANAELEQIDYDRGFNQVTKTFKAFLLWRKKNKERQASEQLRILMEGFEGIGRQDLVDKYTKYKDDVILISAYESCGSSEHDGERFRKAFDNSTEYATLQCLFETVHEGVGMVCRRGTGIGTAFRVGSKYIMTAYHFFKSDIDDLWTFVFGRLEYDHSGVLSSKWDELAEALSVEKNNVVANTAASIKKTLLEDGLWYDGFRNVSKLTEALAAIIGSTETERLTERIQEFFNDGLNLKFNYTKEGKVSYLVDLDCNISFGSKRDDVLILELAEDRRNQQFPRSFKLQTYKLKSTDHIHLIGYPGGKVIQADLHCPLLMETDLKTIHKEKLKYWTETHKPKRYRLGEDDIEAGYKQVKERNDREFFLTSQSTLQGASGAPGFIVHKNVPVVLVMLVEAYPKFFFNLEGDHQKLTDPKFLVAAGIPMSKISQLLSEKNLIDLKEDIFKVKDKSTIGFVDT